MKVVFLEDVQGVANGGEIKEVKKIFRRDNFSDSESLISYES